MTQSEKIIKNTKLNITAISLPITISAILIIAKIYGFFITGSLSILSSLLDSLMDVIISTINAFAIIYASKPPDEDHRFGHNSIEDIVGLMQATFIATSAFLILYKAGTVFIEPREITNNITGVWIMVASTIGAFLIVIYQKIVIKKTKSVVVESDMMHYLTDFLVNIAIVISLLLATNNKFMFLDPILASLIAIYVLSAAFKIGKRSFDNLMDKELSDEEKTKIINLINKQKEIKGFHAFKTRRSGNRVFVQIHVELDKNLILDDAHQIIDILERKIEDIWLESDVIIHSDPV